MKTYSLTELGYFTERQADKIVELTNGATIMKFKVGYSNIAGNCTIVISTDYDSPEYEIRTFYTSYLIRMALCLGGLLGCTGQINY